MYGWSVSCQTVDSQRIFFVQSGDATRRDDDDGPDNLDWRRRPSLQL